MLLTLTTTHRPATDLGFLLHKNPANVRSVDLSFGTAHVFYPEAAEDRCTAALYVEVDPIGLVRGRRGGGRPGFTDYVNDRPYACSSLTSVALARVFGTAMGGRSQDRPELAETPIPLEVRLPVLPSHGGEPVLRRLFEPLGYELEATPIDLDPRFPDWGSSRYLDATLRTEARLSDLLAHLYVLLPVLDDDKHYWVSRDELEKLLAKGGDWLAEHPERELITQRYLRHRRALMREALARLLEEDAADPDAAEAEHDREELEQEDRISLRDQRLGAVLATLRSAGAARVLDLGCGDGSLLPSLLRDPTFREIVGLDVSHAALQRAARRLHLDTLPEAQRRRIQLVHSSLTYRDRRLQGYDAAAVVEVVEHLDPDRLEAFERVLFEWIRPGTIVLTTPNVEFNVRFPTLPAGELRHRDHRFEWTRAEFRAWAGSAAARGGYTVRFLAIGPEDAEVGPPTQMAVFAR